MKTTITIENKTWLKLIKLKTKPSETFDEIISKLIKERK